MELAACAPIVVLLTVGAAGAAQVADARTGLGAATEAAAAAAARAPDASAAQTAAQARFHAIVAAYPLTGCKLRINLGSFARGEELVADSSGWVDLAWADLLPFQARIELDSRAVTQIEPFRTHESEP
ncbi:MAG: hypothetical protein ACREOM_14710 [Candidatus Dormibacteraceae bacterium]